MAAALALPAPHTGPPRGLGGGEGGAFLAHHLRQTCVSPSSSHQEGPIAFGDATIAVESQVRGDLGRVDVAERRALFLSWLRLTRSSGGYDGLQEGVVDISGIIQKGMHVSNVQTPKTFLLPLS